MSLKRRRIVICLVAVAIWVQPLWAGEAPGKAALSLAPSGGLPIDASVWSFRYFCAARAADIHASSFALDCAYGPLRSSSGMALFISAQVMRATTWTSETSLWPGFGTGKMTSSATAGLLYFELRSAARLCPFIRSGLGVAAVDFHEGYSSDRIPDAHLAFSHFAYGYGAGLHYTLNRHLAVSLSFEGIEVPFKHKLWRGEDEPKMVFMGWGDEWVVVRLHAFTL